MSDFYCEEVLSGKTKVPVVYESNLVLAFYHTRPYFEHHVVIIPKRHIESLSEKDAVSDQLAIEFLQAIQFVTSMLENVHGGCRICSNVGSYQTSKHLHWYVHAGNRLRDEDGNQIAA